MSPSASESLVGRVVDGRYRVESHLADGGMASVYVAVDLRLERDVALKIMRPDLARDEDFVSRFRREARSAARLSHPGVVAVFDQGTDGDHVFLAMELVTGQTLRQVIRDEGPLTARAALDIIEPVLQALDAAHVAGIVHRDIKPENVIIREDGVVKVADFGLARAVTTETVTSHTDVLLGTAAYLAPEQVERGIADPRSDVYSAGLILYEMLTGIKAFPGDSPIHVAYQHVHGEVPVPSDRVDSVPAELDALVGLATARDPDDRPTDAGDFLAEVRRSRAALTPEELDGRPASGDPDRRGTDSATMSLGRTTTRAVPRQAAAAPPERPRGRGRRRAVLVVLLALVLASGGAGWWFGAGPGARVEVPRLAGLSQQDAVDTLTQRHLDPVPKEHYDEHVEAGRVIRADPAAGATVPRGTDVELTVSRGPERHDVPALKGRTEDEAKALLTRGHLDVGTVDGRYDEKAEQGTVIATSPKEGTPLKRNAEVALTLSKGPRPIPVADVVGKTKDEASQILTDAGLTVDAGASDYSTDVEQGKVMAQSPKDGTLHRGDQVELTISKGPEMVEVPDVNGKQESEAARILGEAGFKVTYSRVLGGVFHTVRMQEPRAHEMAPKGSTVKLTIV